MSNMNGNLCHEKHERIDEILEDHSNKLENHESRLLEIEKNSIKMDEIVRQNMEKTNEIIESNKNLNATMVDAINKLTDNVTDIKNVQQEQYIDSLKARQELNDKININKYEPSAKRWDAMIGYIIAGIISLLFFLVQSGIISK